MQVKNAISQKIVKIASFTLYILIGVFAAFIWMAIEGTPVVVSGHSMDPNFHNGEKCLMKKDLSDIKRYDVVVFNNKGLGEVLIKRVYALPGETIKIEDGDIYVNGKQIEDKYRKEDMLDSGLAENEIHLGKDEYFVLGDNRNHSCDSRYFGPVQKTDMRGVVKIDKDKMP